MGGAEARFLQRQAYPRFQDNAFIQHTIQNDKTVLATSGFISTSIYQMLKPVRESTGMNRPALLVSLFCFFHAHPRFRRRQFKIGGLSSQGFLHPAPRPQRDDPA